MHRLLRHKLHHIPEMTEMRNEMHPGSEGLRRAPGHPMEVQPGDHLRRHVVRRARGRLGQHGQHGTATICKVSSLSARLSAMVWTLENA